MFYRPLRFALLFACLVATLSAGSAQANPNVGANDPSPIANARLYVDVKEQPSATAYRRALMQGRIGDARNLFKIARHNIFRWIGRTLEDPRTASKFYDRAQREQPGSVVTITVLNHAGDKCGRSNPNTRRENGRYRRWIDRFAQGVGSRRVIIAFEPDSLGTLKCLVPSARRARLRNLKYGIDKLARLPNATVYVEATASDWRPAREVARYLKAVNIRKVRGFMLNATHRDTTARNVRYGQRLSRLVGGKHFVINTSENGNGRQTYTTRKGKFVLVGCNPQNSALGHPPTTTTQVGGASLPDKVDGYLWINRPALSGGNCRKFPGRYAMRGGPKAGTFWEKRALILAERSKFE